MTMPPQLVETTATATATTSMSNKPQSHHRTNHTNHTQPHHTHHQQQQQQRRPLRHDEQEDETFYDNRRSINTTALKVLATATATSGEFHHLYHSDDDEEEEEEEEVDMEEQEQVEEEQEQVEEEQVDEDDEELLDDIEKMKLHFPISKLYGREKELEKLQIIYNRCCCCCCCCSTSTSSRTTTATTTSSSSTPSAQIVFLPGYSGSGKSSLVYEFVKRQQQQQQQQLKSKLKSKSCTSSSSSSSTTPATPATPATTPTPWLVAGKYEELYHGDPYSAITQGFNHLFRSLYNHTHSHSHHSHHSHNTHSHHLSHVSQEEKNEEGQQQQSQPSPSRSTSTNTIKNHQTMEWIDHIGQEDLQLLIEFLPELSKLVKQRQQQRQQEQQQEVLSPPPSSSTSITTATTTATTMTTTATTKNKNSNSGGEKQSMKHQRLKHAFQSLVGALGTKQHPLIFFLDDLQWADTSSISLLESLFSTTSSSTTASTTTLQHFMFLGAYRSNEVQDNHILWKGLLTELYQQQQQQQQQKDHHQQQQQDQDLAQEERLQENNANTETTTSSKNTVVTTTTTPRTNITIETIEVNDLSKLSIEEFVADTLQLSNTIVSSLVQVLYNKTLGNIFYTKHGLEELVRKNGLYYDVMMFRWEWNINKILQQELLSDDVIDMVQCKMKHLTTTTSITSPYNRLQQVLTIASLTRSTISSISLLYQLVKVVQQHEQQQQHESKSKGGMIITSEEVLIQILERGVQEGLLQSLTPTTTSTSTTSVNQNEYRFAHDKIQEAASSFVKGDDRDQLLFHIATVLLQQVDSSSEEEENDDQEKKTTKKGCVLHLPRTTSAAIITTTTTTTTKEGNGTGGTGTGTGEDDWMLFTAIHHLNSIPFHYIEKAYDGSSKLAQLFLAQWNLHVAKLAMSKSAFPLAVELLRAGEACLMRKVEENHNNTTTTTSNNNNNEKPTTGRKKESTLKETTPTPPTTTTTTHPWKEQYQLCLDLFSHKMETEFTLGHHDEAQQAVYQILQNAQSVEDKTWAEFYDIELIICQKERNLALAIERGLEYLSHHGLTIPLHPGPVQIWKEKIRLQRVQGRRKLMDLIDPTKTPPMQEKHQRVMRLLEQLVQSACYSNLSLCVMVSYIGQRLSFEHGMSPYFPVIMSIHAFLHRQAGRFAAAYRFAAPGFEMVNRVSEGSSWVRAMNTYSGCLLPLKNPMADSIDPLYEAHSVGIACGDVEWAITSAMQYTLCFYCAGSPANALFESKLILFEEEARRYRQPPSMIVTFCIFRQTLLNLQGKGNMNPTLLDGKAMKEENVLAQFEGKTYQQTFRDISIFRLLLACVFGDDTVSQEMVDRLSTYPEFDIPVARQHLRDILLGLAAYGLGRRWKDKKYTKLGQLKLQYFKKLAKTGSENASAIVHCLRAEERPSIKRYTAAIEACSDAGFLHFEAMMSERCGNYCLVTTQDKELAKKHFTRALWSYYDWGAMGKVTQLRQTHRFLSGVQRLKTHSSVFFKLMAGHMSDDASRETLHSAGTGS